MCGDHPRHGPAGGSSRESAAARAEYRDLRFHAAGGLGEVFLARNAELNREVALKFLKPGRARDPASLRRFLQEAEVTGRLEHPGVVPIYALGTDSGGAPCYAMRFIRGASLQDAIDGFHAAERPGRDPSERSLALRDLLNRFVSVCNTVAYAHSWGIRHRDLKPQNVMLGKYDKTLVVDWGLAKPFGRDEAAGGAGEEALTPSSGSGTPTVGVVGTLAYMSPEQAEERPAQVGPASDLFSLGAILYAILTGEVPYRRGSYDEVLEKVRCCEFPAPRQIKPAVPRALEAICLKAMAARPVDRYPTALELAADVKRCLADEPVMAWPEPIALRARRWMRRHRTLVTSAAAVLVLSAAGLAGFTMVVAGKNAELAKRSRALDIKNTELVSKNQEVDRQWQRAEAREGLAIDAVRKFHDAVRANGELKNRPELDALRKALLKEPMEFFRTLRDQLQADRDTRPEAMAKLAQASFDLAETTADIGSIPDAIRSHSEALAVRERLASDNPSVAKYQSDLAASYNNLGNLLVNTGRPAEAIESLRRAMEIAEQFARDSPTVSRFQSDLAKVHNNIGFVLNLTGHPAEALKSFERALKFLERLAKHNPTVTEYQRELALGHNNVALLLADTSHPAEALESHRRALEIRERLARDNPSFSQYQSDLATSCRNIGLLLRDTGYPAEALKSFRQALAICGQLARDNPTVTAYQDDLAQSHHYIGLLMGDTGHPAEALESYQRALEIQEHLARDNPAVTWLQKGLAVRHYNVGAMLRDTGHSAEALESCRRAVVIQDRLVRDNPDNTRLQSDLALSHNNIGELLRDIGHPAEALESLGRALKIRERLARDNPSDHSFQSYLGATLHNIAEIEMRQQHFREAREHLERAIEHQRTALAVLPGHPYYQQAVRAHLLNLTKVYHALNQPAQAIRTTQELVALAKESPSELYNVAGALALSIPLVQGEQQQALAAEAVQILKRAITAGWNDAGRTSRDPDLAPLRDRDDFRRLLAELLDRGFPADPFAP